MNIWLLVLDLTGALFALVLFLLMLAIIAFVIGFVGYCVEEYKCKNEETGFFHKVAEKLGMY